MQRGRRLAVDPGSVRVGLAISDPDGILATPLETVARNAKTNADIEQIAALVAEYEVLEVIVGVPTSLSGKHGSSAVTADGYADLLTERLAPIPVTRQDERLTTVTATRQLRERGVKAKKQRSVVDQAAAVVILQQWLERNR